MYTSYFPTSDGSITAWLQSNPLVASWELLDESVSSPDDASYINSSNPSDVQELLIEGVVSPLHKRFMKLRIRAKRDAGTATMTVAMISDGNTIFSAPLNPTQTWTNYEIAVPEDPDFIFSDIKIVLTINVGTVTDIYISAVELVVPDPVADVRVSTHNADILIRACRDFPVQAPDDPDDQQAIVNPDRTEDISCETSYLTDVTKARQSQIEERRGLVERPSRLVEAKLTGFGTRNLADILMNLKRQGHQTNIAPIWCDVTETTFFTGVGDNQLNCDPRWRRFFVDSKLLIWHPSVGAELHVIAQIPGSSSIILATTLGATFPAGSRVYPVIETDIELEQQFDLLTDQLIQTRFRAREVVGPTALPPTTCLIEDIQFYRGLPILDMRYAWNDGISGRVVRAGSKINMGRGSVTEALGARPGLDYSLDFITESREEFWKILNFFDYCRGRVNPVYAINPGTLFTVVNVTVDYVDVNQNAKIADVSDFMDYIAIHQRNGTITIRGVDSVAVQGSNWRITFDEPLEAVPTNIRRVTSAHLVRLSSDAMKESWIDGEHCRINLPIFELIDESDVEIENLEAGTESILVPSLTYVNGVPAPYLWFEATKNLYRGEHPGVPTEPKELAKPKKGKRDCDFWYDTRNPVDQFVVADEPIPGPVLERRLDSATHGPFLVDFKATKLNKGHQLVEFSGTSGALFWLKDGEVPFWSNTNGLTIFTCMRMKKSSSGIRVFLTRPGIFTWAYEEIQMFSTYNVTNTANWMQSIGDKYTYSLQVYAMRWVPGTKLEYIRSGIVRKLKTTGVVSSMPTSGWIADSTKALWFQSDLDGPKEKTGVKSQHYANNLMIWDRALTNDEMNLVGHFMAGKYGTKWNDLV